MIKKNKKNIDKLYDEILSKNTDYQKYCNNVKAISISNDKHVLNSRLLNSLLMSATINIDIEYVSTVYCGEKLNILKKNFFNKPSLVKIAYLNKGITVNYNSLNDKIISRLYDIQVCNSLTELQNSIIDVQWMKQMNLYVSSLSVIDSLTVRAYTYHGDGIINEYIRSNNKVTDNVMELVTSKLNRYENGYDFSIERLEEYYKYIDKQNGHEYKQIILFFSHISHQYFPFYLEFIYILKNIDNGDISKMLIKDYNDIATSVYDKFLSMINKKYHKTTYKQNITNILHTLKNFSIDYPVDIKDINIHEVYQMSYVLLLHIFKYIDRWVWKSVFESYIDRLERIINNSPSVPQTMIVFRGVKQKTFISDNTKKSIFRNKGFVSTTMMSLDELLTYNFINKFNKCCILKIKLLKGSKVLFLAGLSKWTNEIEFLLPMKTNFIIQNTSNNMLHPYYKSVMKDICKKTNIGTKIKVLDMVAI